MLQDIPADTIIDGRYRVLERLGSGGMADVYRAEDQQLGRMVALKLLHRRFADDREFLERFRREASSAAGLQHPNVVGVFDRGEWEGTSYIAMELLEGRTLKQVVTAEGPLDPVRAIDLTVQILRAARFAHKRGIIHRDLKPHNVIVDPDGRAKVTDFGIARAGASDMTETGSMMGTAQYLSPEQAQGEPVLPQSDLYSIGIVLYELLTGRVPFDGESAVTIALKQVGETPVAPSLYNPAVTPELDGIVMHALAKDPGLRFADADEFILALDRCRGHLAAGQSPPGEAFTATTAFGAVVPEPVATGGFPPYQPDVVVAGERDPGARRWVWALVALALIGVAIAAYALTRPSKAPVPNVVGKPVASALGILHDAGFQTQTEHVTFDVPKNLVIRQDPQPSVKAAKGTTITLTVSDGPGAKSVPDVTGKGRRTARRALTDAGFKVQEQTATSDTVGKDHVVSTSPGPGQQADVGSTVTVTVSTGKEQVAVPSVVGNNVDDARTTLEGAGFGVSVTEQADDTRDPGTVISQDPAPSANAAKGSSVRLVVAKAASDVAVPDVTGKDEAAAVNALADAGLAPNEVSKEVPTAAEDGKVQSQSPASGRKVKKGSRVTITVGRFNASPGFGGGTPTPTTPTTTTPAPLAAPPGG